MHLSVALCLSAVALSAAPPPPEAGRRRTEKSRSGENISYENLDLDNYDLNLENYGETIDLSNYDDLYDYSDPGPKIEVGTLAPLSKKVKTLLPTQEPHSPTLPPVSQKMEHPGLFGSMTEQGLPTCLVCVCLGSSIYCDDVDLKTIPPLPKKTVYLYARFNKISRVRTTDFAGLKKLKHVDLSNNALSEIDDDAFSHLSTLQELILFQNQLTILPHLPSSLVKLDAQKNQLQGFGFQTQEFKELTKLQYLYLADNSFSYIPAHLPVSLRSLHLQNNNIQSINKDTFCDSRDLTFIRSTLEDIRLDGNPLVLSNFADGFFCLPRLPVGHYY